MTAQEIIQALNRQGLSDNAIARALGRGQSTITRAKNGQSDPRESLLRALQALAQQYLPDLVRDKPRRSGRGRIARTAQPSYNGVAADNQGSLRRGTPEVTPVEIRAAVAHSAQEPTEATHSGSMPG